MPGHPAQHALRKVTGPNCQRLAHRRQRRAAARVSIVIKGTNTGTITDINGCYSIDAPVGSILVFLTWAL